MIAHRGFAHVGVDYGIYSLPHANYLLGYNLMRSDALNRRIAALHFRYDRVVIVAVQRSFITDLAARFGIKRGVVENDFAFLSGLQFLRALTVVDDGKHFAILRPRLEITFKLRLRQFLIRRICRLLGCAFPGSASALTLSA